MNHEQAYAQGSPTLAAPANSVTCNGMVAPYTGAGQRGITTSHQSEGHGLSEGG